MPARLGYALMTLAVCAFAAMAGVWLAARGEDAAAVQTGPEGWAGFIRPPGAVAPAFRLHDQEGEPVTSDEYSGRAYVVTFVYSTCEDTCPAMIDQVRGALDDTGLKIPLLAISVDPANDTAERARRFLNERRMTGRARFLLGTRAELAPVWRGYGIQPQTDRLDHSATVVLVDEDGTQKVGFPHAQLTPEALGHDLEKLWEVNPATA